MIKGIYKHANRWEARFKVGVDEKTGRAKYRSVYAQSRDEVIAKRNAILGELFEASKVAASGQMNLLILGAGMLGSFSHIDCGAIVQQRAHVKESTWVRSGEIYGGKL